MTLLSIPLQVNSKHLSPTLIYVRHRHRHRHRPCPCPTATPLL